MIYKPVVGLRVASDNKVLNPSQTGYGFACGNVFYPANRNFVFDKLPSFVVHYSLFANFVDSYKYDCFSKSWFLPKNKVPDINPFFGFRDTDNFSYQGDLLFIPFKRFKEYFSVDKIPSFIYSDDTVTENLALIGYKNSNFVDISENPEFIVLKLDKNVKDFSKLYIDFSQTPVSYDINNLWDFSDDFNDLSNWSVLNGNASVNNGVLELDNATISTQNTVVTGTGDLDWYEFSAPNVFGYLFELTLVDVDSLFIGLSSNNSSFSTYINLQNYRDNFRVNMQFSGSYKSYMNELRPYLFEENGKYKVYLALFYLGYYYTISQWYPTDYIYGIVGLIGLKDLKCLGCVVLNAAKQNNFRLPDDYSNSCDDDNVFLFSQAYYHHRRYSDYSLDVPFNTDANLYLFLKGTAKVDSIKVRSIVDINRLPKNLLFSSFSCSDSDFQPNAIAETQLLDSRKNKSFVFLQETSNPIKEYEKGSYSEKSPIANPVRFIRNFKTSLTNVQPLPYSQQMFQYNNNGYSIVIEKKGRDSIELSYDVPLGKYVTIVFPSYMITGEVPKNFKINKNVVEGWVIYDEQITFTVSDEDNCQYRVTLNPVNYTERT